MWPHEQGRQPENKAIEGGQVRGTLSGATTNQQLMFEQQRFRGNGAHASRTEQFCEGDEEVYRQKDQIAHGWNVIIFIT